jgi:hypothetical protein
MFVTVSPIFCKLSKLLIVVYRDGKVWNDKPSFLIMGLLLAVSVLAGSNKGASAALHKPRMHLYVLLGFANNSPGLSEFGRRMQSQGIPTTVASYSDWSSLAQQAADLYQGGGSARFLLSVTRMVVAPSRRWRASLAKQENPCA